LKSNASEVGAWIEAARVAPNLAGVERAFLLLGILFEQWPKNGRKWQKNN
jgi:hypothetical protein